MREREPYWKPTPQVRMDVGSHGLVAILMRNMMEAVAHDPSVMSASPKIGERQLVFTMVAELSGILDDDMAYFARTLAERAVVDWDHVREGGRSRPTVVLDAHVTSRGNLSFRVAPGPLGPDGEAPSRHDWRRFPGPGHAAYERPGDELAIVRDVELLFWSRDGEGPGRFTDFAWRTRNNALASLSGLVLAAWEHCKVALSAHYDVQEGHAPAFANEPEPVDGPDMRSLRIAPPRGSVEWREELRVLATREAVEARTRARAQAEALLSRYGSDPRALVAKWGHVVRSRRSAVGLASDLAKGGIATSDSGAWSRFSALEAALRTVEPDAGDAPGPTSAVPEGTSDVGGPIASAARSPVVGPFDRPPSPSTRGRRAVDVARRPTPDVEAEVSDKRFYGRLTRYAAAPEDLAALSASSVDEVVDRINAGLRAKGRPRLAQGDFPTTGDRFRRLCKLHAELLELPCAPVTPYP